MKAVFASVGALMILSTPVLAYENCAGTGAQRRCYNSESKSYSYGSGSTVNRSDPNLSSTGSGTNSKNMTGGSFNSGSRRLGPQ